MSEDSSIDSLLRSILSFRDARDWAQFHSIKELILSLNLEAAELLELTQWQSAEQFERALEDEALGQQLRDECADVFIYLMLIAERGGFNLVEAAQRKMTANEDRYPADQVRGRAVKHDRLD